MNKYKIYRFPLDAWDKWMSKKKKIEDRIQVNTNKKIRVPLTDVLRFYGSQQRFEWDDNVIPYFTKKKRRKVVTGQVI
jgi:hypothetical protein